MQLIDQVNAKANSEILFFATQGVKRSWQMKRDLCSKCYTTKWEDMLEVA